MDREADSYAILCAIQDRKYVLRAKEDRTVALPAEALVRDGIVMRDVLAGAKVVLSRTIHLSKRKAVTPSQKRIHPTRPERTAQISVRAAQVSIRRSQYVTRDLPAKLDVNVVQVIELDPPAGEDPVEWLLLTNLPIDSPEQIARVVDDYRRFPRLETLCSPSLRSEGT